MTQAKAPPSSHAYVHKTQDFGKNQQKQKFGLVFGKEAWAIHFLLVCHSFFVLLKMQYPSHFWEFFVKSKLEIGGKHFSAKQYGHQSKELANAREETVFFP